jgi:hypothetical protein
MAGVSSLTPRRDAGKTRKRPVRGNRAAKLQALEAAAGFIKTAFGLSMIFALAKETAIHSFPIVLGVWLRDNHA